MSDDPGNRGLQERAERVPRSGAVLDGASEQRVRPVSAVGVVVADLRATAPVVAVACRRHHG